MSGLDHYSKTIALLWQIFLMVGPCFYAVRAFCYRVRSIITDMGAERQMVHMPDFLADFFWFIGRPNAGPDPEIDRGLFPRAMQVHGWRHLWDTLLKRALSSLSFFPRWLESLKDPWCVAVIYFFVPATKVTCISWFHKHLTRCKHASPSNNWRTFIGW